MPAAAAPREVTVNTPSSRNPDEETLCRGPRALRGGRLGGGCPPAPHACPTRRGQVPPKGPPCELQEPACDPGDRPARRCLRGSAHGDLAAGPALRSACELGGLPARSGVTAGPGGANPKAASTRTPLCSQNRVRPTRDPPSRKPVLRGSSSRLAGNGTAVNERTEKTESFKKPLCKFVLNGCFERFCRGLIESPDAHTSRGNRALCARWRVSHRCGRVPWNGPWAGGQETNSTCSGVSGKRLRLQGLSSPACGARAWMSRAPAAPSAAPRAVCLRRSESRFPHSRSAYEDQIKTARGRPWKAGHSPSGQLVGGVELGALLHQRRGPPRGPLRGPPRGPPGGPRRPTPVLTHGEFARWFRMKGSQLAFALGKVLQKTALQVNTMKHQHSYESHASPSENQTTALPRTSVSLVYVQCGLFSSEADLHGSQPWLCIL